MDLARTVLGCLLLTPCLGLVSGCFNPSDPGTNSDTEGMTDAASTTAGPGTSTESTTGPTTTSPSTTAPSTTEPSTTEPSTTSPSTTSPSTTSPSTTSPSTTDATATDTTDGDTSSESTATEPCTSDELCVPVIPEGWEGPIAAGPAGDCPAGHPTPGEDYVRNLAPGTPVCSCNCNPGAVSCGLHLENADVPFNHPGGSCVSPPLNDECLSAVVNATCLNNLVDIPATPTWGTDISTCEGAVAGNACAEGGTCFADDGGFGSVCIRQDGDHMCPDGFGDRTLFFRDFSDTRDCSGCSCTPTGQACEIDVEICSVGFYEVTLSSGGGCEQLQSGDGDGVSILSNTVTSTGSCQAGAGTGQVTGTIMPTGPVTLCCN